MAEPTTIIGESTSVHGNLQGDEDLVVLGRVEGSIQLERTLVVEPSGVVKADVSVRNAVVSGVVVGNVEASESVQLTADGRMVGDIAAPRVIIVEGALFRGRVDMGSTEPSRSATRESKESEKSSFSRRVPSPVQRPKPAPRAATPARRPAPSPPLKTTGAASRKERVEEAVKEEEKSEPPPEPKPAPQMTRTRPTRSTKIPKKEIPVDDVAARTDAPEPPPPKPRVAPKKRRVSVRKKR